MSKREHFQPVQFALLIHDATGEVFSGTISQRDLDGTRRLAESVLKVVPEAVTVWVHLWMGTTYAASCVEVVRRPEAVMPAESLANVRVIPVEVEEEVSAVPEEVPEETLQEVFVEVSMEVAAPAVPVEPSPEPIPFKRKGGRPPTVKQEA